MLPGGGLVLAVTGRTGPPSLRFETADGGRMLLRQGERTLLGRADGTGCCRDLAMHRFDGYGSPLPPIRSALMRAPGNWAHRYATWLEVSGETPLHDARWQVRERRECPPYVWGAEEFVRDWPGGSPELYCGGGWNGVLPLRRLSSPETGRVKAYRKHAREGTLAPVLLWWVTFLDGWLILDGHDRAVAALAEGRTPPCVVLARVLDEEDWRRTAEVVTEAHERLLERSVRHHPRQRAAVERGYADFLSSHPYDPAPTRTWPLPGGPATWDDLAARVMFECPRD